MVPVEFMAGVHMHMRWLVLGFGQGGAEGQSERRGEGRTRAHRSPRPHLTSYTTRNLRMSSTTTRERYSGVCGVYGATVRATQRADGTEY